MASKLDKLKDLFREKKIIDNFDESEIVQISKCETSEHLDTILKENEFGQDFRLSLAEILIEAANYNEEATELEDNSELDDLYQIAKGVQKIKEAFSEKYFKMYKVKSYLAKNTKTQNKNNSDLEIQRKQILQKISHLIEKQGWMKPRIEQSIKKALNDKDQDAQFLEIIQEQIMPLDIDLLQRFVQRSTKAGTKIEDRSGIVFIGQTGAGKSTTILGLVGHEMVQKEWQGIPWITPKRILSYDSDIKNIIAVPSIKSVTKNVTAITLRKQMLRQKYQTQDFYLIDTPGFNDTRGSIMDIANTFGTSKAVKSLKSARFVILFSGKDQKSRSDGIIKMANTINQLFPKYSEIKSSVVFVFNRYDQKDIESMSNKLKQIWKGLSKIYTENKNFQNIYNDLINKTKDHTKILRFNPLGQSKEYMIDFLNSILESSSQSNKLQTLFSICYGQKAKSDIQKQTDILRSFCLNNFQIGELNLSKYYLQKLLKLGKIMKKNQNPYVIQDSIRKIQSQISSSLEKKCTRIIESFNKLIDFCSLTSQNISEYFQQVRKADSIYKAFEQHLSIPKISKRLEENMNDKISPLVQNFKQNISFIEGKTIECLVILLIGTNKKNVLEDIKNKLQEQLQGLSKKYKSYINEYNFNLCVETYNKYKSIQRILMYLNSKSLDFEFKSFPPIQNILSIEVNQKFFYVSKYADDYSKCTEIELNQIKLISDFFKVLQGSVEYLRVIDNRVEIKKKIDEFNFKITAKVTKIFEEMEMKINQKQNYRKDQILQNLDIYKLKDRLALIPHLKNLIFEYGPNIQNKINNIFNNSMNTMSSFSKQIDEDKVSIHKLKFNLLKLDKALINLQKIQSFVAKKPQFTVINIQNSIKKYFEQFLDEVKEILKAKVNLSNCSIRNIQRLRYIMDVIQAFNKDQNNFYSSIFQNAQIIELLNEIKQNLQLIFQNNIKQVQNMIKQFQLEISQKNSKKSLVFSNIKIKEVETSLAFVLIGEKIYEKQKQKQKIFKNLGEKLIDNIKNWKQNLTTLIKERFNELQNKDEESFKLNVQQLKKMLENQQLIKKNIQINKIFEEFVEFTPIDTLKILQKQAAILQQQLKSSINLQNNSAQLQRLKNKSLILSLLDPFYPKSNIFSQLHKKIKRQEINLSKNQLDKLKYACEANNFSNVQVYLKKIIKNQNQQQNIGQAFENVVRSLKKFISQIKNQLKQQKNQIYSQKLLDLSLQLIQSKLIFKILEQNNVSDSEKLMEEAEEIVSTISNKVKKLYEVIVAQIQNCINKNYLQKAFVKIQGLQKVQKLKKKVEGIKEVCQQKSQKFTSQILNKISGFSQLYGNFQIFPIASFKEDYDALFDEDRLTCPQLYSLKTKIIQRVMLLIEQKRNEISGKQSYTNNDLSEIKQFFYELPEQIKSKKPSQFLIQEASTKYQQWEKKKKALKQQVQRTDIFEKNKSLNQIIINYFKDPTADETTKIIILSKIQNHLRIKVKVYSKDGILCLVNFSKDNPQIRMSQQIKNQKYLESLKQVYVKNWKYINDNITSFVKKDISDVGEHIMNSDSNYQETQIIGKLSVFMKDFLEYTSIINLEQAEPVIFLSTKQQIKSNIEQLTLNISQHYKKSKQKLNNLKYILDVHESQGMRNFHISLINKLRIMQNSIEFIRQSISHSESNNIFSELLNKGLNSIVNIFTISEYIKKVEEVVVFKYKILLNFSIKSQRMMKFMDKNEIDRQFREKLSWLQYLTKMYIPLLESLGMNKTLEESADIKIVSQRLEAQNQQIIQQIVKFGENPQIKEDIIENIRWKQMIHNKYSEIFKEKNVIDILNIIVQANHRDLYNQALSILRSQKQLDQKNQQTMARRISEVDEQRNKKLNECEENFKLKKQSIELNFEKQIVGLSQSQILDLEKSKDCDLEAQQKLKNQQIKKQKYQYDDQIEKIKQQTQQVTKDTIKQVALQYQKMVSITQSLIPTQQLKNDNSNLLKEIKSLGKKKWLKYLYDGLKGISSTISGVIIANNHQLKQLSDTYFSKNIESLTIDQVIESFVKQNKNIEQSFESELKKKSKFCNVHYDHWIEEYKKDNKAKQLLIKELKNHDRHNLVNETSLYLLGKIFALWTILTSKIEDGLVIYNYKPHPAQIIASVLLFGLPNVNACKGFKNRFAQIKTGQGKSLILAVVSTYFALNGYEVDSVCYSKFLSSRDRSSFQNLFSCLDIQNSIKYCTFDQLTQSYTNNNEIKLRRGCNQLIQKGKIVHSYQAKLYDGKVRGKILLIDEVDVFFIDQFYGNYYSPSSQLKSPAIKRLYSLIWRCRDNLTLKKTILSSMEFKAVIQQFPRFKNLITNLVNAMIGGVKNYKHQYQVNCNKILYKNQDGYTDKISYGYKTIFAYFHQFDERRISELPPVVSSIDIALCEISYAELPKMYEHILGVSGSLTNLPDHKKQIMANQYGIQQNYAIPSVYKKSARYDEGYKFVSKEKHYAQIIKNLQYYHEKRRPVLIFCETLYEASNLYDSQIYIPYRNSTVILSQKHNEEQRKRRIMRSTSQGKISLITRAFSRGIDFIIYESNVIEIGGAHMIVIFTIQEKSEETQIIGRVARQGDPGSSVFIISHENLQDKLDLNSSKFTQLSQRQIQSMIDEARDEKSKKKQQSIQKSLMKCKQKHDEAIKLFSNIRLKNQQHVLNYLIKLNQVPEVTEIEPVRTVLALDATKSMARVIRQTTQVIAESFVRTYTILSQKKVSDGFQVQIAIYRNYNCKQDQIFVTTPFESTPKRLVQFIRTVDSLGGWGNEALQIVYDHCLKQENLKQLIIIGDAPANTIQQTIQKRNKMFGQKYWAGIQKYQKPFDSEQLLTQIENRQIPIQSLSIGPYCQRYFERIALKNQGKHQVFDPHGSKAISQLTDFITQSILDKVGERTGVSEQLINHYRKTYKC